jgi:transcriptional regulator with XRE-family HTH domain
MSKKLVDSVAYTIKKLRKTNDISQEELADRAGMDRTYISGVERGVRNITLDSLESIIVALQVNLPDFLAELSAHIHRNNERNIVNDKKDITPT